MPGLQREPAERIAGHGVESRRHEHEVGRPARGRGHDRRPEVVHVERRGQTRPARHVEDVPDTPLVRHARCRDTRDAGAATHSAGGIGVHQRLGPVAVVHVPIDDEHPGPPGPLRVPGGDHHIVHQAEPHPLAGQCVMARGSHRGEGVTPSPRGRDPRPRARRRWRRGRRPSWRRSGWCRERAPRRPWRSCASATGDRARRAPRAAGPAPRARLPLLSRLPRSGRVPAMCRAAPGSPDGRTLDRA